MASPSPSPSTLSLLLLLFSLISLFFIGANARPGLHFHPCNTLFISFSFSSSKTPFQLQDSSDHQNPSGFFSVLHETNEFDSRPLLLSSDPILDRPQLPQPIHFEALHKPEFLRPVPYRSLDFSDRTKDIISIVVGLLFGVCCGALTAATLYLAWSVFSSWYEDGESDGEDEDYKAKPKGMGYVKIPNTAKEGSHRAGWILLRLDAMHFINWLEQSNILDTRPLFHIGFSYLCCFSFLWL